MEAPHVQALTRGSAKPGSVVRGRPGSKYHVILDAHDGPMKIVSTGGTCVDVTWLLLLVESTPPLRGLRD